MNRPKPAHPHQLRDAARILAVGLHRHRRQRGLHVSRFQKSRFQASLSQPRMQPLRKRPSLQADAIDGKAKPSEEGDEGVRIAANLRFLDDLALGVHDADARQFQRNVNSGIMLHGCPP
jgi:hypothetical protein